MSSTFDEVIDIFNEFGQETYMIGEPLTQLDHALQAAHIALFAGAPDHIVIGMLLHDIGQLVGRKNNNSITTEELHVSHDDLGYQWLKERQLPQIVCDIARYHTAIKVMLCQDDPSYFNRLSFASQASYLLQKEKYSTIRSVYSSTKNKQSSEYSSDLTITIDEKLKSILKACRLCDDMAKITLNHDRVCTLIRSRLESLRDSRFDNNTEPNSVSKLGSHAYEHKIRGPIALPCYRITYDSIRKDGKRERDVSDQTSWISKIWELYKLSYEDPENFICTIYS
ncbi:Hypothetical protein HVR_LOCUS1211 [uncultured virus]|nr:Hypothetical protein HVR_LOCUS1211 [uncultured virus]